MTESFHLGTIGRIRVGLNWSVLLIAGIVALSLATAELPSGAPGYSTLAYWLVGAGVSLVFLASLLAHELAHAFVARRHGVGVRGIVLWALGGVAKLDGDAPDPGAELRIAAVGPLVSFVVGVLSWALAVGLADLGAARVVVAALAWLAGINVLLAVFNLLPAYPLDGGRVLRALLWRRRHDRLAATRVAARVGTGIGTTLIAVGLAATFFVPGFPLNGIWLALVGWFLRIASREESHTVAALALLGDHVVADAMRPIGAVVPSYATLDALVERSVPGGRSALVPLVEFSGAFGGLADLRRLGEVPPSAWPTTRASAIAWHPEELAWLAPTTALREAAVELGRARSHCAAVFVGPRLVGTLSAADLHDGPLATSQESAASSARVA